MNPTARSVRDSGVKITVLLSLSVAAALRLAQLVAVPFGWHPDEATKALLARDVLAGKYFPAFFSAFTGREALYVYLEAIFFALLGERIFATRLLSAFIGILTVALTFLAGKVLFNRRAGLFAAIFIATSLWHLIASRNGYRAVLQPLVQLPVIILLFQGWRAERGTALRSFAFAGLWLGLTQYTYTAARFFPILVIAIAACAGLSRPKGVRVWKRELGLMLLISAIVFLPLAIHFLQNPIDFYGRAEQISIFSPEWSGGDPWARLWQSVKESARMFAVWGDINYRFNIAGQPVFGPIAGILFYAGLLLCTWRLIINDGYRRPAYAAILLWLIIMMLPMTLSAESLPYYQRAIGILPVVYLFPALALEGIVTWLRHRAAIRGSIHLVGTSIVAVVLLAILGARAHDDYFGQWHVAHRNDDDRRVAMVYVADYLRGASIRETIYLSTQYPQHPTLALLAPEQYDNVRWFDATQSLPLPADGSDSMYLLLLENEPQSLLLEAASSLEQIYTGYDRFERKVFEVYKWTGSEWPVPQITTPATWSWEVTFEEGDPEGMRKQIELPVNFGDVLAFRGHNRNTQEVQPGQTLGIVLFWELLQRPQRQYTFFAHLLNAQGEVVAGYDANSYATTFWPDDGGELLLSYFPLAVPADAGTGVYQVEIGVYHQPSGERLPILQNEEAVADRLLLEPVRIP